MKTAYKNDMPMLKLKVKGSKGQIEYDAFLDTGAGRTLIPEKDAKKFGLTYAGDTTVITGFHVDLRKRVKPNNSFIILAG
jgi:predicted aspartyl protease